MTKSINETSPLPFPLPGVTDVVLVGANQIETNLYTTLAEVNPGRQQIETNSDEGLIVTDPEELQIEMSPDEDQTKSNPEGN